MIVIDSESSGVRWLLYFISPNPLSTRNKHQEVKCLHRGSKGETRNKMTKYRKVNAQSKSDFSLSTPMTGMLTNPHILDVTWIYFSAQHSGKPWRIWWALSLNHLHYHSCCKKIGDNLRRGRAKRRQVQKVWSVNPAGTCHENAFGWLMMNLQIMRVMKDESMEGIGTHTLNLTTVGSTLLWQVVWTSNERSHSRWMLSRETDWKKLETTQSKCLGRDGALYKNVE